VQILRKQSHPPQLLETIAQVKTIRLFQTIFNQENSQTRPNTLVPTVSRQSIANRKHKIEVTQEYKSSIGPYA
jgi:hypothetical protein|tara:strand:+ start:154 stop:372 length:219 start_codon:yes stop_codon:yes gene_type:complete